MKPTLEKVAENFVIPEGPHWDVKTQTLYYVDLKLENLYKYVPSTNQHAKATTDNRVSLIVPVEGKSNEFVITQGTKIMRIFWDGSSPNVKILETIAEEDAGYEDNTFNDGKADAAGNLWAGTMSRNVDLNTLLPRNGSFYSVNKNKEFKRHFSDVSISNGLAWSIDNKYFYYIDSGSKTIDRFNFDINTGTLSNREPWFSLQKHYIPGIPDGQAIDTDGNLWVAIYGGARVIKIDGFTKETILYTLEIPSPQVTSCAFGGANLDELYVTVAKVAVYSKEAPSGGGVLYKVKDLGAKGFPGMNVKC